MEDMLNPTVFIYNFEWREPVTTLTDMLVALVAWYGFFKFSTYIGTKDKSFTFFRFYFLCFALGMTSAAWFGHGLQAYVGPELKRIGWIFGATGLLLFGIGSLWRIKTMVSNAYYLIIRNVFIGQYVCFIFLMLHPTYSDFVYAQLSSTVSLIVFIFPFQLFNYIRTKSKGGLIIIGAIIYSIIPGLVYNNQVSISKWFNYHDISHVLMAVFMTVMIIGTFRISTNEAIRNN